MRDINDLPDEFISGENTRLRSWLAGLGRRLFAPPFLPAGLVGLAALVMATNAVAILVRQPAERWGEYKPLAEAISVNSGVLDAGPWVFLLIALAYIGAACLGLAVLHRPVAYFAWLLFCMGHLASTAAGWLCGEGTRLPMFDPDGCRDFSFGLLGLAALAFGILLAWSSAFMQADSEQPAGPLFRRLSSAVALAWCAALGIISLALIMAPRPAWTRLEPAHAPSPRTSAALAYDPRRGTALLFGGAPSWSGPEWVADGETWEWDGADWVLLHPERRPAARLDAAMAFDEARGVTVLFGGVNHGRSRNDTWEWDGTNWSRMMSTHTPGPRCCFDMYYDSQRKKVVLYGGYAAKIPPGNKDVFYTDMWEWDGQDWRFVARDETQPYNSFTLAYDRARGTPLMVNNHGLYRWQDGKWQRLDQVHAPVGRWSSAMTFLPDRALVVLFGGHLPYAYLDDTWLYNGLAWEKAPALQRPPGRENPVLFYTAEQKRLILFGGYDGKKLYNDTWELVLP